MHKKIILPVLAFIILFSCYRSLYFLKISLSGFLKINKNCEFMCKHPFDAYKEKLAPIKDALPLYKEAGFITDKHSPIRNYHWFRYRITRYMLYPALLEDSTDKDLVVGFFNRDPEFDPSFEPVINVNNEIILLKRKKRDF